jgi:5,10-methylenetetrahydrofolate reductase
VITSPIFDSAQLKKIMNRIDTNRVAVVPTVLLLKSAGMARYIDRNVRNISVPPQMIQSIQKAADKVQHCVKLAAEMIARFKDMGTAGALISTIGWEEKVPQILDRIRH